MPYKDPLVRRAKNKIYSAAHYKRNAEKVKSKTKEKRLSIREEWKKFKKTLSCSKCGFSHPAAMDFHHEDPSTKTGSVNTFIRDGRYKAAFEEAKKCVVLCANCHRVHHYEEHYKKKKKKRKKGAEAP